PAPRGIRAVVALLFEEIYDAFKFGIPIGTRILNRRYGYGYVVAVQQHLEDIFRDIAYGGAECALVAFEYGFDLLENPDVAIFAKRGNASAADAKLFVGYDRLLRDLLDLTQAVAYRAGAVGRMQREGVRCRLGRGEPWVGVHEVFRVMVGLAVLFHGHHYALPLFPRTLYGLRNAMPVAWVSYNAVYHHFDIVNLVTIHLHFGHHVPYFAVDPYLGVSRLAYLDEQFPVVTLTSLHDRCQYCEFRSPEILEQRIQDLVLRLPDHLVARHPRIGLSRTGEQQAHE